MGSKLQRQLYDDLETVHRFVLEGSWTSLGPEDRRELEQNAAKFAERLKASEDQLLCAGFLGGTGVGKSSLMNALARTEVAGTSHRRPHTEEVLIYHHAKAQLPAFIEQSNVAWKEHPHQAEAVKDILLCDLPDFDSLRPENKAAVLELMSYLDLLVWVASPEKYADRSLHTALRQSPKAVDNFYFVFNKIDRLWNPARAEESLNQMRRVAEHFRNLVVQTLSQREQGREISNPRLFLVSAVEDPPFSTWNQLALFRDALFSQRSAKQVAAIKAANLDQEMLAMLQPLHKEKEGLEHSLKVIQDLQKEVEEESRSWDRDGQNVLSSWVQSRVEPLLADQKPGLGPLYGPARLVGWVAYEWRRRGSKVAVSVPEINQEKELKRLNSRFENLKNRLLTLALRQNQSGAGRQLVENAVDVSRIWNRVGSNWQEAVDRILTYEPPGKAVGIKVSQWMIYSLLTLFLAFGLGGKQAWLGIVSQPGLGSSLELLFSILESLFSPMGLAALLSYILLMLGSGIRLYNSLARRLQSQARRQGQLVIAEMNSLWNEELKDVHQRLADMSSEMHSKLDVLQTLLQSRQ